MVRYLLSLEGVDVSVCTADGMTGLHLAALHEYREVAEVLLHHGISPTMKDIKYVSGHKIFVVLRICCVCICSHVIHPCSAEEKFQK